MSTRKHDSYWEHLLHEHGKMLPKHDLSHVPADAEMKQLADGSRVMVAINDAGVKVTVAYRHGPDYYDELRRLGIRTRSVRFRVAPLLHPNWTAALHPPEQTPYWGMPIPEDLRGCTGTFVTDPHALERQPGWYYKYQATALVRIHRPRHGSPGTQRDPQVQLMVPLVWLESAAPPGP